ncbi:TonB-dependent receptor domain-containing protein [Actinobacillus vicugnae]|uniref:TonB-dependent receptor domain-containing protein n=1 Tax=Actinobacillus vicugnae TaxID=2573093 RepID=UPI00313BAEE6
MKKIKLFQTYDNITNRVKPTLEQWKAMLKGERKDHAWAPSFGATIFLTDYIRLYARYNETKRMPSIFEDTLGYSTSAFSPLYLRKPEHSKNIEVGYIHDLTGFFPKLHRADIRLNYFYNTTRNIFDRNQFYEMQQFDKRVLSGLELQARYDQGNFFADLGVSYQLKNKFCDKSSSLLDTSIAKLNKKTWTLEKYPECVNAGNANGYLQNVGLPKYSITSNIGFRLFDGKLELGSRWLYHTRVKHTRARSLRKADFAKDDNVFR